MRADTVMVKKIIFLVASPFSGRDRERYGFEILRKNGFGVEVWDLAPFLFPELVKSRPQDNAAGSSEHRPFSSSGEVISSLGNIGKGTFIVCMIHYDTYSYWLYRAISRQRIPYAVFTANTLPIHDKGLYRSNPQGPSGWPSRISAEGIVRMLLFSIPPSFIAVRPAAFVMVGGRKPSYSRYPVGIESEVLRLHSLDYDIYMEEKKKCSPDDDIAVFLDEYVPFHPDYLHMGVSSFSGPDEYYPLLRDLFDAVERAHKVRVVIAAHPRSEYGDHQDYFGRREVVKGKTASLVKRCRFAIAHSSTAINFCVLFKKPVIFVTTDRLNRSPQGALIDLMATLLGERAVNIGNLSGIDLKSGLSINGPAYDDYRNTYIKQDGSVDVPFWQAVSDRLKKGIRYP